MTQTLEAVHHRNGTCEIPKTEPFHAEQLKSIRLNIGAGRYEIPGFISIDRKNGTEAYPLEFDDKSVDEIVASHILEHFSHLEVGKVVEHWFQKLKPGGRIRIAVPDFENLAKRYLAGDSVYLQGYVMGGHVDADDRHGCLFDRESLEELMIAVGFERVGAWDGKIFGAATLPISLNLQGFKPISSIQKIENVRAIMSVPRFGPLMHPRCAEKAFYQLGIPCRSGQSCFWHQKLSELMEEAIADPACDFVLTMDFDTVFCAGDVLELYRLMHARPDVGAIFPLQSKRGCETALFSVTDAEGNLRDRLFSADLERFLLPANTGHFGLTMIRADSLRAMPRPWMVPEPAETGRWDGGHRDADIDFWKRFKEAGFKAYLAPRVVVGHLEEVVKWPGRDLRPIYQQTSEYEESGIPAEVER